MAKQNKKTSTRSIQNHRYVGLREAILTGGTGSSPGINALAVNTNSGGATSGSLPLHPIGLTAVMLTGTTASPIANGSPGNVCAPLLRGLYNKAIGFQWYRITRAKFVFVGAQGTAVTGIVTLAGYTSPMDVNVGTGVPQLSGPNTKSFDLASAGSKELSVPVPVDSSWKKVTHTMSVAATSPPFFGGSTSIVNVSSVDDICFGVVSYTVGSGPVGTGSGAYIGSLFLDYDVEFKGVIDNSVNA